MLCSRNHLPFGKKWQAIDPKCAVVFAEIMLKLDYPKMVVTSCWRVGKSVQRLTDILCGAGVPPDCVLDKTRPSRNEQMDRGHEIKDWLAAKSGVTNYIIIDDEGINSFLPDQMPHLFKTNSANGLTHESLEETMKRLENVLTEIKWTVTV